MKGGGGRKYSTGLSTLHDERAHSPCIGVEQLNGCKLNGHWLIRM